MKNGIIFNIQKFSINDGPGIRTTVFVKGCPLNCLWCHNPESKSSKREIFFDSRKCISCGRCAEVCSNQCHIISENGHAFLRDNCISCGDCTKVCYPAALESVGYEITVEDAIKEVMKDEIFYQNSGGGMTVSGGEPMAQFEFTLDLLMAAKEKGLHTCMETCGFAPTAHYEQVAPYVDIFLFDFKLSDEERHLHYTGVSNGKILENLYHLDDLGASTVLRCPIIPTVNDNMAHFEAIAATANRLKHVLEINIEPYHPLGSGKSEMLGKDYELRDLTFPENETVEEWIRTVQEKTKILVRKA